MEAGKLRHRITIQQPVEAKGPTGEDVPTWTDLVTIWAEVADLQGREYLSRTAETAATTVRVVIRERSDIDTTMRVVHGSRILGIEAVIRPSKPGNRMQLMCREIS
jgi:SPP1 family predicted phage head-tail adaptor